MSICLANGHSQARFYSLIMLRNEAELIRERRRQDFVLYGTLTKMIFDASNTDIKQDALKELNAALRDMLNHIGTGHYG